MESRCADRCSAALTRGIVIVCHHITHGLPTGFRADSEHERLPDPPFISSSPLLRSRANMVRESLLTCLLCGDGRDGVSHLLQLNNM